MAPFQEVKDGHNHQKPWWSVLKLLVTKPFLCLIMLLCSFSANAQDGVYLQINPDKVKGFGNGSVSTTASVSSDNTRMAVSFMISEIDGVKAKGNYHTLVMDLTRGKVLSRLDNSLYQYIGDYLLRFDYENAGKFTQAVSCHKVAKTFLIDQKTFLPVKELPLGNEILYVTSFQDNYMLVQYQFHGRGGLSNYNMLYSYDEISGLKEVGKYDLALGSITADKNSIIGTKIVTSIPTIKEIKAGMYAKNTCSIVAFKTNGGTQFFNKEISTIPLTAKITSSGEAFYGSQDIDYKTGKITENVFYITNGSAPQLVGEAGAWVELDKDERYLISVAGTTGKIGLWDIRSKSLVSQSQESYFQPKESTWNWNVSLPFKISGGKQFLIGYSNGIVSLYSVKEQMVIANLFFDKTDWAMVAKDGRMDGTPGAFEKLEWHELKAGQVKNRSSLSSSFSSSFTPYLMSSLLNDEVVEKMDLQNMVAQAPTAKILKPQSQLKTEVQELSVEVQAIAKGDPVADILIYVNGKLSGGIKRGFQLAGEKATFLVGLSPGENTIGAKAVSQKGYESEMDQIIVQYSGRPAKSNLHILAVGIDIYYNPKYNLNYAIADASAFVGQLENQSKTIFESVNVTFVKNSDAKKSRVFEAMDQLAAKAQEQDVFVFYYAGHGVMSEGSENPIDFYLALHDVTQMYGRDDQLALKGISAIELRDKLSLIKAQKQLIIFDACQSGGAVETFARRGAAEEKAMLQLARSSGVVLIASTGSDQYASEFDELGHGVFTYSILEGMNGKADGMSGDKKITVKELESWVNDRVPSLSQQHKGSIQFPQSWSKGQDFPIVLVP